MTAQNIQFRGIRHTPSDITGQDGDLLDCVNLVHEDGELKPIAMPEKSSIAVPTYQTRPYTLAHIHNTIDGDMFVFVYNANGESRIRIRNASNVDQLSPVPKALEETVKWVQSVGNTLIVGTDKSIHYVLYKGTIVGYKWLGDSLPRPVIDFQLEYGELISQSAPTPQTLYRKETEVSDGLNLCAPGVALNVEQVWNAAWGYQGNNNRKSSKNVRDNVLSKIATITKTAKDRNQFLYPFFIRYALRLYDGSYVCQSQPILMLPSTMVNPLEATINFYGDPSWYNNDQSHYVEIRCNIYLYGLPSRLKFKIKKFVGIDGSVVESEAVDEWSDIIKGVDLFCSSQISQVDNSWLQSDEAFNGYTYSGIKLQYPNNENYNADADWLGFSYTADWKRSVYQSTSNEIGSGPGGLLSYLTIPSKNADDYLKELETTKLFYLAKSYKLAAFKNNIDNANWIYFDENVDWGTLTSIESARTLPDDYVSRWRIAAETGHTYNKRLILGNIKAELPLWYPITDNKINTTFPAISVQLRFEIEKNGKTIIVAADKNGLAGYRFGHYIYYPDPDCKRVIISAVMTITSTLIRTKIKEIPMVEHEGLNGAYAIMPDLKSLFEWLIGTTSDDITLPTQSADRYYPMRNSIAMAEVANPFTWQAENFKEAGNGSVIDLAPNMMEVSSGQWGQYPLYVFTTDGIYAFGINNDGTLGTSLPVSSDVLLIPQGMTKPSLIQTNQMLVFLTNRGVMGLQGTKVQPLSLVMNGRHFNAKDDLGNDVVYGSGVIASIMNEAYDTTPFHDFMLGGYLAYDYTHNRVLLLNADVNFQYVLSLDNLLWSRLVIYDNLEQDPGSGRSVGMVNVIRMSAAVSNYTEMYLQGEDHHLYITNNVTEENISDSLYQYGYFITRPMRFGTDDFKSITRLLHRYTHYAERSDVKLAIYASRDGVRYHRITTLRGMSWRYYIFVVYTCLKPNERYSYMTVDFEPRLTNKLR